MGAMRPTPGAGVIPTYLSHSYREEDRDLNIFFWELFHDGGFAFTVDSRSRPISTPHLELMMRRSACFVAVVARRDDQARYRCSPFAVYEFGLAVQANVRSLVLVERGVPGRWFPQGPRRARQVFDRGRLDASALSRVVEEFKQVTLPDADLGDQVAGDVGIILPDGEGYEASVGALTDMLDGAGYTARRIRLDSIDATALDLELETCEFVVMDVASPRLPGWILGLVRGRFIPTVPLVRVAADGKVPPVPSLCVDAALDSEDRTAEQVISWSTVPELMAKVERHVASLHLPRRQFRSLTEGEQYFRSLGRISAGPVFLSNAGADDALASQVARAFELNNISYFHYLYRNTIEKGTDWEGKVLPKVAESTVFVALLSERYWDSDWCRREFDYAERLRLAGKLTLLPYFLDRSSSHPVAAQGTSLTHLAVSEQTAVISGDVDRLLVTGAP
jgi:hypothetical protein